MIYIMLLTCLSGQPDKCSVEQIPLHSKNVLFCNASLAQFTAAWLTRHPNRVVKSAVCVPVGEPV